MIYLTYKLYYFLSSLFGRKSLVKRIYVRLFNILLPVFFKFRITLPKLSLSNKSSLIVSLTSFPERINKINLVIESILYQTKKPDRIVLWLSSVEFSTKHSLPVDLLNLEKRGLEIRFCEANLMPHKKYFYTMKEFPNSIIVTVDDDMFYPPNLIKNLLAAHENYPNSIICPITMHMFLKQGKIAKYSDWQYIYYNTEPSNLLLTMTGSGCLFPPNSLHLNAFNEELICKYALKTDDIWVKIMSLKAGRKVMSIAGNYFDFPIQVIHKRNASKLETYNIEFGNNDKVLENLIETFNIDVTIFNDDLVELAHK